MQLQTNHMDVKTKFQVFFCQGNAGWQAVLCEINIFYNLYIN